MFKIDENNLRTSISEFFQSGHTVMDLLNHALLDPTLLEKYLVMHMVQPISSNSPGLIVQVYLLISKLFDFDVYGALNGQFTDKAKLVQSNTKIVSSVAVQTDLQYASIREKVNMAEKLTSKENSASDPTTALLQANPEEKSSCKESSSKKLRSIMPRAQQTGTDSKSCFFSF